MKVMFVVKIPSSETCCCEKCTDVSDEPGAFIIRVDKCLCVPQDINFHSYIVRTSDLASLLAPHEYGSILTLRRLMSYIYGAPILDVSTSHTMTQHSR